MGICTFFGHRDCPPSIGPQVKRLLEDETLFPEGLERVPPRYAIHRRNNWMLEQADLVVSYVDRSWGGAAQQVKKARAMGKRVVNLPDVCDPSGEDE